MVLDTSARPPAAPGAPAASTRNQGAPARPLGRTIAERSRPRRWTLRRRAAIAASSGALIVAGALAFATYFLVRDYVVDQRINAATRQAVSNARLLRDRLGVGAEPGGVLVESVRTESGGVALLRRNGEWFSSSAGAGPNVLPETVAEAVVNDEPGRQVALTAGVPTLYVVVPMPSVDASYVEAFRMTAAEDLLRRLRNILGAGAIVAGLFGAVLGGWSSRRALRPLGAVGRVARAVADGDLDRRIEHVPDPDLEDFTTAFNNMTDELTERINREARFASDVSHELRTPLTSLGLAVATLERRRDDLSDRSQQALDIVSVGVTNLQRLVAELLELAQLDAGTSPLASEAGTVEEVVRRSLNANECAHVPLITSDPAAASVSVHEPARLERICANLAGNASAYGRGLVSVTIDAGADDSIVLLFDDTGPGIAPEERGRLFDRFARGAETQHIPGSGLGLSIVREHAHSMGGDVRIEDRPGGGCRFVVELPIGSR